MSMASWTHQEGGSAKLLSKLGKAVDRERTYIIGLSWGNVHQSRGIGIGDDVGGRSRCEA